VAAEVEGPALPIRATHLSALRRPELPVRDLNAEASIPVDWLLRFVPHDNAATDGRCARNPWQSIGTGPLPDGASSWAGEEALGAHLREVLRLIFRESMHGTDLAEIL